ncbi:MAG: hypothetical protein J7M25_08180 [Deltaproteobacteria bacterium]|nr:hypothetical protein [Deltaproteobacteria bacterium]
MERRRDRSDLRRDKGAVRVKNPGAAARGWVRLIVVAAALGLAAFRFVGCSDDSAGGRHDAGPDADASFIDGATDGGGDAGDGGDAALSYQWEPVGPTGGFIAAVAFDPNSGRLFVSGDDDSGLYYSDDDGQTWVLADSPTETSVYGFVFDPDDPNVIYGFSEFNRGLLKSSDDGTTWQAWGQAPWTRIHAMAIAATGRMYIGTETGLFVSDDSGQTWSDFSTGLQEQDVWAVAVAGSDPENVFAGTGELDGSSGQVYRLEDDRWRSILDAHLPVSSMIGSDSSLYVGFFFGSVFKADGEGRAWRQIAMGTQDATPDIPSMAWTHLALAQDTMSQGDVLYVAAWCPHGFFEGREVGPGGWRWIQAGSDLEWAAGKGEYGFSVAVDPADSSDVLLGTIGNGLYRTKDGGASLSRVSGNFLATDGLALAVDPQDSNHLLVSSTELYSGTPGLFQTSDGGSTWNLLPLDKDVAFGLWISPRDSKVILAGFVDEGLYRSADGGQTWNPVLVSQDRHLIVNQILTYPGHPGWVLAALGAREGEVDAVDGLYLSKNDGQDWDLLSDLGTSAVAVDPDQTNVIYQASLNLFVSHDSGATWQVGGLSNVPILRMAASPSQAGTLYLGGVNSDLYRSTDFGATVERLDLPSRNAVVTGLLLDPNRPGVIYVAHAAVDAVPQDATYGLLRSSDGGQTWKELNDGLFPSRAIWTLAFAGDDCSVILAGLWGGGTWRLTMEK